MLNEHRKILKQFSPGRIILPILLGLGVAVWLFLREFDPEAFEIIPNAAELEPLLVEFH